MQIGSTKHETTHFSVSDLKTDVPYNFRITAKNSVGTGPPYIAEEPIAAGRRISKKIARFLLKLANRLSLCSYEDNLKFSMKVSSFTEL